MTAVEKDKEVTMRSIRGSRLELRTRVDRSELAKKASLSCGGPCARRRRRALVATFAVASFLFSATTVLAQLPTPIERQLGPGAGGQFKAMAGRNGVIYAGSDVAGIFVSTDNGNTWRIANGISTAGGASQPNTATGMTSTFVTDILWHPTIADRIIVSTTNGIYVADGALTPGTTGPNWVHKLPVDGTFPKNTSIAGTNCTTRVDQTQASLGSVAALAADTTLVPPPLFAVSGVSWYQSAGPIDTNRDLLYSSTDGGNTWTISRIRLGTDPPCIAGNDNAWLRSFADVEAWGGRVWVASIDGKGVFSAARTNLSAWREDNIGLYQGCGLSLNYGAHPIEFQKYKPPGQAERLYVLVQNAIDRVAGVCNGACPVTATCSAAAAPSCNAVGCIKDFGVYYRTSTAASGAWSASNGVGATALLPIPGTPATTRTYSTLRRKGTALYVARSNINFPFDNNGFLFQTTSGSAWYPVSNAQFAAIGDGQECGTGATVWGQLGNDVGPYEFGVDGYLCCSTGVCSGSTGLAAWHPNYGHNLDLGQSYSAGPPITITDTELYDVASGLYVFDNTRKLPTIPRHPRVAFTEQSPAHPAWAG